MALSKSFRCVKTITVSTLESQFSPQDGGNGNLAPGRDYFLYRLVIRPCPIASKSAALRVSGARV